MQVITIKQNNYHKMDQNIAPTTECKEGYYYIVRVNKHRYGAPRYLTETLNTYLYYLYGWNVYNKSSTTNIKKAARFYTKEFTKDEVLKHAKSYVRRLRSNRYKPDNPNLTQLDDLEIIKRRCHYHKKLEK